MATALTVLGILIILAISWFIWAKAKLARIKEVMIWYNKVNSSDVFYIPKRIQLIREKLGSRMFSKILNAVDVERD